MIRLVRRTAAAVCVFVGLLAGPASAEPGQGMTNADVVKLLEAGMAPKVVIQMIFDAGPGGFDTSTSALVELKNASVPEPVVMAILDAAQDRLRIEHDPVGCVVAEQHPYLYAQLIPADSVQQARLRFRAPGGRHWYSVAMENRGDSYSAVLPKPKPGLESFEYYIDVIGRDMDEVRTEDYSPRVVGSQIQCESGKVAMAVGSAVVPIVVPTGSAAPLVPLGFSEAGVVPAGTASAAASGGSGAGAGSGTGAGSAAGAGAGAGAGTAAAAGAAGATAAGTGIGTTTLLIAGGAVAAGVGVAAAASGGDEDSCRYDADELFADGGWEQQGWHRTGNAVCYPGFNCPRQGGMASYCMEVSCNDISWYLRLANGQRLTCYSTSTSFDGWYGCFDEWEAQCY